MRKLKFLVIFIFGILIFETVAVIGVNYKISDFKIKTVQEKSSDDFYFVQLTDTHVRNKLFDKNEASKKRLTTVLETIISFENKPAFIVITGDLCQWGNNPLGALNCITFVSCFYEKNDQLYADANFTIPVYTTPGNHDYCFSRNLKDYHKYIDKNHIESKDRYIVNYSDVSLFFMDSGPNYYSNFSNLLEFHGEGLYDNDIEWLQQELSQCQSNHKIVLMHHPAVGDKEDVFICNRQAFVELCETYDVELVLAGHTHSARVFDSDLNKYDELLLNCSLYPTLYVQSDDCKEGVHYRNVSIKGYDVWLESSEELKVEINPVEHLETRFMWILSNLSNKHSL